MLTIGERDGLRWADSRWGCATRDQVATAASEHHARTEGAQLDYESSFIGACCSSLASRGALVGSP